MRPQNPASGYSLFDGDAAGVLFLLHFWNDHFQDTVLRNRVNIFDIDGYYDKNPNEHKDAKLYKTITELPEDVLQDDSTPNNPFATGGIVTKLKAADFLMKRGKKMLLCNGFDLSAAESFLLKGEHTLGTLFTSSER